MANSSSGNMMYCDTASTSIAIKSIRVIGIMVRCTHASNPARITLAENNSGRSYPAVLDFEVPAANKSTLFDFSTMPLLFPSGIRIVALTDCTMTLITDKTAAV